MPPHSEVENDPLVDVRLRRRKRSRSISPRHFRKTSERHEFNNNHEKYCLNKNVSGSASTSSSRSSSVSSEVRLLRAGSSSTLMVSMRTSTTPSAITRQPVVVNFHEAPSFLQFNPFIYRGYRTNLGIVACIRSLFWWTNETLNAWTHLLGWIYFAYFTVDEVLQLVNSGGTSWQDSAISLLIVFCFQICMAMSTGYHTFCCHSKDFYHCWLSYDLCGISFSLLAIYTTGIYYAFWCQNEIRTIYITISGTLFVVALILQTTPKFLTDDYSRTRLIFFVSWSCFGFLPCIHWILQNGGFSTPNVFDLVSQIGIMYLICGAALFFYVSKVPEIWFPGSVDFIGSSHQWWHVIIFLAFCHWQMVGKYFADMRSHHGCFEFDKTGISSPSVFNVTNDNFHPHGTVF
ncbi:progestin and adipoQ receptor family member 3-like [Daphnia pulex]|uniref:progestin and adipoQ receptor family member 3-like n=1 Tax=Daphnia pulex TaxID=6669 RepID=UPI001EDFEEE3|nr:progestin and adipoQ receptor family member 3-like [Daphnia pulex]